MRLVLDHDDRVLRQPSHAAEEQLRVAPDELRPAGEVGVEALEAAVVERQHVVLPGLDQEQALQLARACRAARRRGRAPASSRRGRRAPRRRRRTPASRSPPTGVAVPRHRGPALVVDAAVAEHLEVLRRVAVVRAGVVERVRHRDALERLLLHAVDAHAARAGRPPRAPSARRRSRGGTASGSRPWP